MIFLARLLFRDIGKNIKKSEVVFRVGISTLSVLIAAFHAYFCICFAIFGLYSYIPISIACLALYIIIIMMNRKKVSGSSGILFVLVPAVYAVTCVYLLGWDFGAQWYLLALIAPVYLIYEEFSSAQRRLCISLLIISMLLVYYITILMPQLSGGAQSNRALEVSNVLFAMLVSLMAAEVIHFGNMFSKRRYKNKLANLSDESNRDTLTNLWNRKYIENALTNLFWDDTVNRERIFIASVDIDHYKKIIEDYGHDMADSILKKYAQTISKAFRGTDIIARWEGDAFLVVLKDTDEEGAFRALENFKNRVRGMDLSVNENKFDIRVTIGYVACNADETYDGCIKLSNDALTHGKNKGRDLIVNYRDVPGAKNY